VRVRLSHVWALLLSHYSQIHQYSSSTDSRGTYGGAGALQIREAGSGAIGCMASEYEDWLRCGVAPALNLMPGEFVFFACYAATGLVPPLSSFLLTLLEFYGVQLHHLSPHSFISWQSSFTSVRFSLACDHRFPCSGYSTCCVGSGKGPT
jgi:hypothetical protein